MRVASVAGNDDIFSQNTVIIASMRITRYALLLVVLAWGCQSRSAEEDVKTFAQDVARDVSVEGPSAWRKHFADSPAFFMAVNGRMAFPNSAAATTGIEGVSKEITHIELQWGDDLRVDPLTPNLAVVAASYHEVQVHAAGNTVNDNGFFTAVAEKHDGHWQFRDAHWSSMAP
jgi:hypothetical protein